METPFSGAWDTESLRLFHLTIRDPYSQHPAEIRADWALDQKLEVWIHTIDEVDGRRDYFRYPSSSNPIRDAKKRGDKEVSVDWVKHFEGGKYLRTFNGRFWIIDDGALKQEKAHLYSAAFEFVVLHNLLRQEFCDGR